MKQTRVFCLFVLSLFVANGLSQTLPPEEQLALDDLAEVLNLANDLYCGSTGITCQQFDNDTLHVISINLPNTYQGSTCSVALNSSFSTFSYLTNLTLAGNCLLLQNLTEFITSPYLRYLDLSINNYDAAYPTDPQWWGTLENLQFLNLAGIYLGEWPVVANLTNLRVLALQMNGISDQIPDWIGTCTGLEYMDLSGNQLHGSIPDSIGNLRQLNYLNLATNQLTGSIPDAIGNLVGLTNLYVGSNRMNGVISQNFSNLVNLAVFTASYNSFTGSIPTQIGNLVKLITFDLSGNKLTGEVPDSICNCVSLEYLKLANNHLTGFPPCSGDLRNLIIVDLTKNNISSPLPADVSQLTKVSVMLLSGNKFYGPLPPTVWALPNLQILDVSGNQLSGSLPSSGYTGSVFQVYLQNNKLNGTLPPGIAKMPQLSYLYLYNNQFSGSIEHINFTTLSNLAILNLSNNSFIGSIPESLGYLPAVTSLDLSYNQFTGVVPYTLSYLSGTLTNLKLNNNNGLKGKVSEILSNLFPNSFGQANFAATNVCCILNPSSYPYVIWPSQCAACSTSGKYGPDCTCAVPRPVEGAVCHLGRYIVDCGADVETTGGNITIDSGGLQIIGNFISNKTDLYIQQHDNTTDQVGEITVEGNVTINGGMVNLDSGLEDLETTLYTVVVWNGTLSGVGYEDAVVQGGRACQQVESYFSVSEITISVIVDVNDKLCDGDSSSGNEKHHHDDSTTIIIVCVCIVVAILAALGVIAAFKIRKMKQKGMLFKKLQVTDIID